MGRSQCERVQMMIILYKPHSKCIGPEVGTNLGIWETEKKTFVARAAMSNLVAFSHLWPLKLN